MSKQTYNICYDGKFDMVVEIDHSVMTADMLHEINGFWSDDESRLINANGDITVAVLKLLAAKAFQLTLSSWDAITAFDRAMGYGQEGWPSMDGSEGIKIVRIDDVFFDADDIEVRQVKEAAHV